MRPLLPASFLLCEVGRGAEVIAAVRRCGARYILIDLGFLVDPEAEDERRAIQSVVRSMVLVRKDMDVTIFLIVHPRNDPDAGEEVRPRDHATRRAPAPSRQDADMVLIVTRELPTRRRAGCCPRVKAPWPQTRIYIDKNVAATATCPNGRGRDGFDPKALVFADTWDQTPMGRAGVLIDTTPSKSRDEATISKTPPTPKGGVEEGRQG